MKRGLNGYAMHFLRTISLCLLLAATGTAQAESIRILVQSSPLAGSQYYALDRLAPAMRVGDALTLIREPNNRYDRRAIRVEWQGQQLGYVPRAENRVVAKALDGGERLSARISRLRDDPDPWRRVEFEVFVEL